MYSRKRKWSRDPKLIFAEHREVRNFLELRADLATLGEQAPLSKLSEAEQSYESFFLRNKRNWILSEARCEMKIQELEVESADLTLHESNLQINSHRMELYQANRVYDNSRREQIMLHAALDSRERVFQETRVGNLQEIERLRKSCCTEAEKSQRLRMDELFPTRRFRNYKTKRTLRTIPSISI